MNFDDLIGKTCSFYGVDNGRFRLGLDWEVQTFEAVEDPDDGYRSMMEKIENIEGMGGVFFARPVAMVVPARADEGDFEGYELRDAETGHVWLRFGTSDTSDYYPYYTFEYMPSGALVSPGIEGETAG